VVNPTESRRDGTGSHAHSKGAEVGFLTFSAAS
jgi:hypothetical protein